MFFVFIFFIFSSSSTCQSLELILGCTPAPGMYTCTLFCSPHSLMEIQKSLGFFIVVFDWILRLGSPETSGFDTSSRCVNHAMKKLKKLVEWIGWIHRKHTKSLIWKLKKFIQPSNSGRLVELFCCFVDVFFPPHL